MAESIKKQDKLICPNCKGNGFIRVPYPLAKEEIWADCEECNSQGHTDKIVGDSQAMNAFGD